MASETIDALENNSVFGSLDRDAFRKLDELVESVELESGEVLFEKGEPGSHLYTINEGLLKISVTDAQSGREKTLALIGEDEIVGEMAVFSDQDRSGRAIAVRNTDLLKIPEKNFLDILSEYPTVGKNLIQILSKRLLMSDREIQNVTFQTIPGRLAAQLLRLAEKFGTDTEDGRTISIKLTHDQLADLVGTNRETITRYLSEFREEGSIKSENQKITILDPEALEEWL